MQAGTTAPPPSEARARVLAAYLRPQQRRLEEPEPGPGQESEEGADPAAAARAQALAAHRRLREIDTEPFKFGSGMRLDANSDYRFSNFYATAVPVTYQGLEYPTSEHAFQASRFPEA
ncbi:MAG: hypothetical protein L7S63_08405, partial [Flavobacteriales bacterium]|nr:hypothetical protein [Flavobacteriales bacterium]